MKRNILVTLVSLALILLIIFAYFKIARFNSSEFNYNNAKKDTINYLNKNEKQLKELVNELYQSKSSTNNPYKDIGYATYDYLEDFNFKEKIEYIKVDLNSQGMLGGQYYGLIYSNFNENKLIVYDEFKETGKGNNIFIREKIKNNWYFYYDDFDGKVDVKKIK